MDISHLEGKKVVNINDFRAAMHAVPKQTDNLEWMQCSGGCGRQVVKPAFMANVKISGGGSINVLCPKCQKKNKYEADLKKKREQAAKEIEDVPSKD